MFYFLKRSLLSSLGWKKKYQRAFLKMYYKFTKWQKEQLDATMASATEHNPFGKLSVDQPKRTSKPKTSSTTGLCDG